MAAIKKIGVIGAGQMGSGIAHVCALGGLAVHLSDIDETRLKHALQSIEKDLARQADKGKISENDGKAALARITSGVGLDGFKDCDLVIEAATSAATHEAARELTKKLGKTPVESEDFPAFLINRILMPMVNEAIFALYEGVGSAEDIDAAMKLGAHHPMGPLELADFIGLDTCLAIMNTLRQGFDDPKYQPCPLLAEHVEAGRLGRKSGRGFYDYA